jgi:chromosome segregation ATPase
MSIEWEKVEMKPEKDFKVQGKLLIDFRAKIVNYEKEFAAMKEEILKLSKVKSDLEGNLRNANETIKKNEAKIQDLEKAVSEKTNTISSLNGKVEGMKVSLDTTITDKDAKYKQLLDEKNALEKKIASLEGDKTLLRDAEVGMTNRIKNLENDLEKLLVEIESVRSERDDLAEKLRISDEEMAARDYTLFKKMLKERAERAAKTMAEKKL